MIQNFVVLAIDVCQGVCVLRFTILYEGYLS